MKKFRVLVVAALMFPAAVAAVACPTLDECNRSRWAHMSVGECEREREAALEDIIQEYEAAWRNESGGQDTLERAEVRLAMRLPACHEARR
jgi:hypothetical protein